MKIKHNNTELNQTFILNNKNINHKNYDLCIIKISVDNHRH